MDLPLLYVTKKPSREEESKLLEKPASKIATVRELISRRIYVIPIPKNLIYIYIDGAVQFLRIMIFRVGELESIEKQKYRSGWSF